jgi:hypothetical protein
MGWAGHVACMGEKRNAYRVLAWKSKGKGKGYPLTCVLAQREVQVQLQPIYNLALEGGVWSVLCSNHFTTGENSSAHSVGGWMGFRAGLNGRESLASAGIQFSDCAFHR